VRVQWASCHNVWFVLHRGVPVCAAAHTQKYNIWTGLYILLHIGSGGGGDGGGGGRCGGGYAAVYSGESFAAAAVNVLFPVGVDHGKKITERKRKIVSTPRRRPTIMRHVMWYAPLETRHGAM